MSQRKSFVTCPFPLQAACVMEANPQEPHGAGNSSPWGACLSRPRPSPIPKAPFPLFLSSNQKVTFRCVCLSLSPQRPNKPVYAFSCQQLPSQHPPFQKTLLFQSSTPTQILTKLQQSLMKNLRFGGNLYHCRREVRKGHEEKVEDETI